MRGLGHAVSLEDRDAKLFFDFSHELRRQSRAARTDEAQMFRPVRPNSRLGARRQHLMNRRYSRVPTDTMFSHSGPKSERVEARRNDYRSTGEQSSKG